MRLRLLTILTLATASCGSGADDGADPTVDEILALHVSAMGGAAAFEGLRNVRATVHVVEPTFTVDGVYRATSDGRMRVDIYADGEHVFAEGIDDEGAWQQAGADAIRSISGEPANILKRGADLNTRGLFDLAGRGHTATLAGQETVGGTLYHVLRVEFVDGFGRHYYINPATWMIESFRETSALHPDLDAEERPAETRIEAYEEHCGVQQPVRTRKVDIQTGEEIQNTRTTSFDCNVDPQTLNIDRRDAPISPSERPG